MLYMHFGAVSLSINSIYLYSYISSALQVTFIDRLKNCSGHADRQLRYISFLLRTEFDVNEKKCDFESQQE